MPSGSSSQAYLIFRLSSAVAYTTVPFLTFMVTLQKLDSFLSMKVFLPFNIM